LLSSAFWEYLEKTDQELWQAAAGFIRTYAYLIQYEIDFRKGQELGLIPDTDGQSPITYERFSRFIAPFAELEDDKVRPRYQYGEMRLTRLNWFARIFLRKLTYFHVHAQLDNYMARFLAPFLTIFLLLSTILAGMQVELTVQTAPQGSRNWNVFARVSRWFSVVAIILVVVISILFVSLLLFLIIHGQIFARKLLRRKGDLGKSAVV
jgi:hypothetical protein